MSDETKDNIVDLEKERVKQEEKCIFRKHSSANKAVTIIQTHLIQNTKISPMARFIICYLISLPDDWVVNYVHLGAELRCKKDKVSSLMDELIELGYVKRTPRRLSNGRVHGYITEYSDSPVFIDLEPGAEKTGPGEFSEVPPDPVLAGSGGHRLPVLGSLQITTTLPCLKQDLKNNNNNNTAREDVVVVLKKSLDEIMPNAIQVQQLREGVKQFGIDCLLDNLLICQQTKKPIHNLGGLFWAGVRRGDKPNVSPAQIAEKLKSVKPKPTMANNQAWWQTLGAEEKDVEVQYALAKSGTYPEFFKTLCGSTTITDKLFHEHPAFVWLMEQVDRGTK